MTIEHKNKEIAKMIGWKIIFNGFYYEYVKPNGEKFTTFKKLIFHEDVNWQFEALDWIDSQGYGFSSYNYSASITEDNTIDYWKINTQGENRKEAIFKCLFEFSQYIKNKKL